MIWVLGLVAARPNWPIMLPFVILLVAIALAPLIAQHHWERHYHKLCVALTGIVCLYHLFVVKQSARVVHAGIDYVTFMVVVGSFFVVAGGIHLRVKSPSGAMRNTLFLFVGALLGNLIGTIGASILLIRPWIAMNKGRAAPMHIAFFIFLVSNIGGALLPVGPPLFLGFLKGVPFGWTLQNCWLQWLLTVAIVLAVFFVLDLVNLRARKRTIHESEITQWRCDGAQNFLFLFALLAALIAMRPGWREPLMVLIALGSYFATPQRIREADNFTFAPLKEVGWLFLGIFGTMIPVLEFMEQSADKLGLASEKAFFWATGFLSALLDNAPTYLAFFAAALGLHGYDLNDSSHMVRFISENGREVIAISLGATFFGALTYIGNAPNLFVKTIAEHARVPTPSFIGYIWKFAMPILIPIFVVISILFFR
ncbi:MAG: sodium:proton antiporter [Verrucomicrobia bacterium]|nr:MAG: sodium:proton antiporter [Verrucomicrobiota bacterium]